MKQIAGIKSMDKDKCDLDAGPLTFKEVRALQRKAKDKSHWWTGRRLKAAVDHANAGAFTNPRKGSDDAQKEKWAARWTEQFREHAYCGGPFSYEWERARG